MKIFFAALSILCLLSPLAEAANQPNVVLILADDLGFSDLGCYGGEIETPNLDALASRGLRFTNFYNTARCWPTRAAIMTGYYAQQVRRDSLPSVPGDLNTSRPAWARLLPEMLKSAGYRSYHSGKWHIDGTPIATGFDHSYWMKDDNSFFYPQEHLQDDRPLPPVDPDQESGKNFYTTTAIASHAIQCLRDHAAQHSETPFFHYIAFTSPHFPLHAPAEDIARYQDRYHAGWEQIRKERWQRLQKLGILQGGLSPVESAVGSPYPLHVEKAKKILGPGEVGLPVPWEELTEEQRTFQAAKMSVHAAMVYRMDQEIGRVLDQVRAMDAMENTLIIFLSDNGASAEIMVRGGGHDPSAPLGSAATYPCLGAGWSTSCNTPFRRHKTWVHEGGISTPLIVHWPKGFAGANEFRSDTGHVVDLLPTILEVAGGKRFDTWEGKPLPTPPGKSLVPSFAQDGREAHEFLWWYHEDHRAIRAGNWKLVSVGKEGAWELYNLSTDRSEMHDLATEHPEKVQELEQAWNGRLEEIQTQALKDAAAS